MGASGGEILKTFKEEIDKIADRHEHAIGYAPGGDNLDMDDWSRLNEFLKEMRKTYSELSDKYAWQLGLNSNDVDEVHTKCYDKMGKDWHRMGDEFQACLRHEALIVQAQKGKPLNL
jgi:hypothetical protein